MKSVVLLILITSAILSFKGVDGAVCYRCTNCTDTMETEECAPPTRVSCFKTITVNGLVSRGCYFIQVEHSKCMKGAFAADMCVCNGDLCNSSPDEKFSMLFTLVAASLAVLAVIYNK